MGFASARPGHMHVPVAVISLHCLLVKRLLMLLLSRLGSVETSGCHSENPGRGFRETLKPL